MTYQRNHLDVKVSKVTLIHDPLIKRIDHGQSNQERKHHTLKILKIKRLQHRPCPLAYQGGHYSRPARHRRLKNG